MSPVLQAQWMLGMQHVTRAASSVDAGDAACHRCCKPSGCWDADLGLRSPVANTLSTGSSSQVKLSIFLRASLCLLLPQVQDPPGRPHFFLRTHQSSHMCKSLYTQPSGSSSELGEQGHSDKTPERPVLVMS